MKPFSSATFTITAVVLFQVGLYLPSTDAECCPPPQNACIDDKSNFGNFCFNCEYCNSFTSPRMFCGVGSCNLVGCSCDGGCILYDDEAWCVQRKQQTNSNYSTCYVLPYWTEWIKDPKHQVHNINSKIENENNQSSTYYHIHYLVSLVRPTFSDDPLTKEEFIQMVQKLYANYGQSEVLRNLNLYEEFEEFDTNNDGLVYLTDIDLDYKL